MSAWPVEKSEPRFCNFCGRNEHDVDVLLAGSTRAFICDCCVDQAAAVVAAKRRQRLAASQETRHGEG